MARLNEDAGNYRAPAARKPVAVRKPVKRVTRGQINPAKRDLGNQPYRAPAKKYKAPAKKYKAPAPRKTYRAPVARSTSRSNGTGRSSNYAKKPVVVRPATGATSSGTVAPTVAKPVAPKNPLWGNAYLAGDTTYGKQMLDYKDAMTAYDARYNADKSNYGTTYNDTVSRLGTEQKQGASDLAEDYAGRGLLESGIYANALNDYNADYTTKTDDLARAKALYETDLANERTDFIGKQGIGKQQALQDALNRYNLKYK